MDLTVSNNRRNKIHPWIFALLAACASILMMFASLTSAYVVRHAAGNWLEFALPQIFFVSAGVMIASSIVLHMSYSFFKKGNEKMYKLLLIVGAMLGLLFLVTQYMGWMDLNAMGIFLDGNPSGSFVYAISGLHAAHVLGGIATLIMALVHAFGLKFKVTDKRKTRFQLTLIYWHFVDILWIYLLLFMIFQ